MNNVDIPRLYRGKPLNLWVEDVVTAAYLQEVWGAPDVRLLIAGGNAAVDALARHADENNYPNVFGLVDRDFGPTNRSEWMTPGKTFRRFVWPVHELENFLLDESALAACIANDNRKSMTEISQRLKSLAGTLTAYMTCRNVVADLRRGVLDAFPSHPHRDEIPDLVSAEEFIRSASWFQNLSTTASSITSISLLKQRLEQMHQKYHSDLSTEEWRESFSGKELFRDIASFIYRGTGIRGQQRDLDVAKAVGR